MTSTDIQTALQAKFAELNAAGTLSVADLRAALLAHAADVGVTVQIDAVGGDLACAAIVGQPERTLVQFKLGPLRPEPSVARKEISERAAAQHAMVDGIVDALELRHRYGAAREQLRELGGKDGPTDLLYDLVGLGANTLRELLHLHTRANRRLLTALQSFAPASPGDAVHVEPAGGTAAVRLDTSGAPAVMTLENRRTREVVIELPGQVPVCKPDGDDAQTVKLRCTPERVTLAPGARCKVEIRLQEHYEPPTKGLVYLGELVLGTADGGLARVAFVLKVVEPIQPKPQGAA